MKKQRTKYDIQLEQQFIHNLHRCIEAFPQYTIAQHLLHILRKKKATSEPYFWTNEKILSNTERYYDELIDDLASGNFDDFEN